MTDVEAKTSMKRKNFPNAQDKKGFAKKAKLENAKTLQKGISPKQKFNKKNKRNSESENNSPQKLKSFPGTQAAGGKIEKKKGIGKKGETESTDKKKRNNPFRNLETQVRTGDKKAAIKTIENKLKEIESRDKISKTAKRKIKSLQRLKNIAEGKPLGQPQPNTPQSKSDSTKQELKKNANKQPTKAILQKSQPEKTNGRINKNQKVQNKKGQKTISQKQAEQVEDDSDDDIESDSDEAEQGLEEESSDENEVGVEESGEEEQDNADSDEEEEDVEGEESADGEEAAEGEESAEEAEDESDEDEEEEDSPPPPKIAKNNDLKNVSSNKKQKTDNSIKKENTVDLKQLKEGNLVVKNQKRFVLFVGNIPYDTNKQDLIEHFKKSGEIRHIRIPTEKKSLKPRGFAYVELANEESYQKCLSMHHTFLKGRRINVLYTQGGKKKGEDKKKEIKAKNFKLHAMRKQGQLAGSIKQTQKRSFRRAKKTTIKRENEEQQD